MPQELRKPTNNSQITKVHDEIRTESLREYMLRPLPHRLLKTYLSQWNQSDPNRIMKYD